MKKILLSILMLSVLVLSFGTVSAVTPLATDVYLFSDTFEDGLGQWTIDGGAEVATIFDDNHALIFGTTNTNYDRITSVNIDTTGYENIRFSYDRMLQNVKDGSTFRARYSVDGGISWTDHEDDVSGDDDTFISKSVALPTTANDNSDVVIRFVLTYADSEYVDVAIDNVLVIGDEMDLEAPEITNVNEDIANPTCSDDVKICATITDVSTFDTVLTYDSTMSPIRNGNIGMVQVGNTDVYCADLSIISMHTEDMREVTYSITATDIYNNIANSPTGSSADYSYTYDCEAPTVTFTPETGVEGTAVDFTFTGSDTVSTSAAMTYIWDFGETFTATSNDMNPSHNYMDDGTYTVTLSVTDEAGHSTIKTQDIVISDLAPTANAGSAQTVNEGTSVHFIGTSLSSPDALVSTVWTLTDGAIIGTTLDFFYTFNDDDVYVVTLTAEDDDGSVATDTVTITVTDLSPTVNAGADDTIVEGSSYNFDATVTSSPDTILSYEWTLDTDAQFSATTEDFTKLFNDDGVYTFTLNVFDEDDTIAVTDTIVITVTDLSPTVNAGADDTIVEGSSYNFDATVTSSPDTILSYSWMLNGVEEATDEDFTKLFNDDGVYTFTLNVFDEDDTIAVTDTIVITVTDLTPTANAGSDQNIMENDLVQFDSSASISPAADMIGSWLWDFGNGVTSTEENPTYTYLEDGTYTVTLTVTDEDTDESIDTMQVVVGNHLPVITNLPTTMNIVTGETFTYQVTFSDESTMDAEIFSLTTREPGVTISPTGMISWNPTTSQLGQHTVTVMFDDGTDYVTADLTVMVYDYMISLDEGWNLISMPLVAENDDLSVANVFGSLDSQVKKVWSYTYDEISEKNVWEYAMYKNGVWENPNFKIIPGYGYYVLMKNDAELFLNGETTYMVGDADDVQDDLFGMPPSVTLAMNSWNLIGVYGLQESQSIDQSLVSLTGTNEFWWDGYFDIIYNEDGQSVGTLYSKEGYWLSMKLIDTLKSIEYKANYNGYRGILS